MSVLLNQNNYSEYSLNYHFIKASVGIYNDLKNTKNLFNDPSSRMTNLSKKSCVWEMHPSSKELLVREVLRSERSFIWEGPSSERRAQSERSFVREVLRQRGASFVGQVLRLRDSLSYPYPSPNLMGIITFIFFFVHAKATACYGHYLPRPTTNSLRQEAPDSLQLRCSTVTLIEVYIYTRW